MNTRNTTIAAAALVTVLTGSSVFADRGPMSDYFLSSGDQLFKIKNRNVESAPTQFGDERAIVVRGNIRTVDRSRRTVKYDQSLEHESDSRGRDVEVWPSTDATTDGLYIYAKAWIDDPDGGSGVDQVILRLNMDWTDPVVLFELTGGRRSTYYGVTYDPTNHSLWVSGTSRRPAAYFVRNYSMNGDLLSEYDPGYIGTALALDHADGTLWMGELDVPGVFRQYSKSGDLLQECQYDIEVNVWGGEFDAGAVARVEHIDFTKGTKKKGGIRKIRKCDDRTLVAIAEIQRGGGQVSRFDIALTLDARRPSSIRAAEIVLKEKITDPGGVEKVFLMNWDTGEFDRVETRAIGKKEKVFRIAIEDASPYVKRNGEMILRITHSVAVPQNERPFKSKIDVIQVRTRE